MGKTAIARRIFQNEFEEAYKPTIAAKPWKGELARGNKALKVALWDIAGHTLKLHPAFYSGANGALLVCDLTNKSSVDSLSQWHNILLNKIGIVPVIVLANKADINAEYDLDYIKRYGYDALEVSSKTGQGIDEAIDIVLNLFL